MTTTKLQINPNKMHLQIPKNPSLQSITANHAMYYSHPQFCLHQPELK